MGARVRIDRQGRLVIPLPERERLGVAQGGTLALVRTPEGILLERRQQATVRIAEDGAPLIVTEGAEPVTNEETLEAIHRLRDGE